jgi:hypothetical protein
LLQSVRLFTIPGKIESCQLDRDADSGVKSPLYQSRPFRLDVAMTALTIFLARLIGLFAILVSLSMVAHKRVMVETTTALLRNGPLLLITGMVGLVAGLAMVLSHNVWSGGALPVVVTLSGWIILVRSLILLFLSPEVKVRLYERFRFENFFYFYAGISFVFGVYLTWAAFSA